MKSRILTLSKTAKTNPISTYSTIFPDYDYTEIKDISDGNVYISRAVKDVYQCISSSFENAGEFSEVLKINVIKKAVKDYIKYGNGYIEIQIREGIPVAVYYVPCISMVIETTEKTAYGIRKIYRQNDTVQISEYMFDDKPQSGNYIIHFMNYEDNIYYGTPYWISCLTKASMSNNADIYNDAFFKNDAKPDGILYSKGDIFDDETENNIKYVFETNYSGPSEKHKLLHLSLDENGDIGYLKFNDKIIDMSFINLLRETKIDIAAAFGIPPEKIGIEVPGKLGNSDYSDKLDSYYSDIIEPMQVYIEEKLQICFGDVSFKRHKSNKYTELIKMRKHYESD